MDGTICNDKTKNVWYITARMLGAESARMHEADGTRHHDDPCLATPMFGQLNAQDCSVQHKTANLDSP